MHIILGILKIIGILLLSIIALILIILLAVLLIPLRYELTFAGNSETEGSVRGGAGLHWLLHLLNVHVKTEGRRWGVSFSVLHFPIKKAGPLYKEEAAPEEKPAKRNSPEQEPLKRDLPKEKPARRNSPKQEPLKRDLPEEKPAKRNSPKQNPPEQKQLYEKNSTQETAAENSRHGRTAAFSERIRQAADFLICLPEKTANLIMTVIQAMQDGGDRLNDLNNRASAYISKLEPFLSSDAKSWYGRTWHRLRKMLKHYVPRRVRGTLAGGTGSPDTTAVLAGMIYKLLPADSEPFVLTPDFYKARIEGDITVSGHVRMIHAVAAVVLLLIDKETRTMIRRVMRMRRR